MDVRRPAVSRVYAALAALWFLAAPVPAHAQAEWNDEWPQWGAPDAVILGVGLATGIALEIIGGPKQPRWDREILLDLPLRKAIGSKGLAGEKRAAHISDATALGLLPSPLVVAGIGGFIVHDDNKLGSNFVLFAAESMALSYGATNLTKTVVGRARPKTADCYKAKRSDPNFDCEQRPNVSFFSGHSSAAFTGAGLLCAFGSVTPFYGDGAAKYAVCGTALGAATLVGVLRLVANKHHLSDVLIGATVGLLSGWVWPAVRYR